jgi:lysophospholipase L1-like esterase
MNLVIYMNKLKFFKSQPSVVMIVLFSIFLFPLFVSAQKKKVSCVGNSITVGYDFSDPYNKSYPGQLRTLLGATNWEVGNFGESSRTMLKSGGYSYWDSQVYKNALASNPNYLILKLGTNDSKRWLWNSSSSSFKTDYKAMVQSFQKLSSKPEIWICLLIPSENASWEIYKSDIKDKVNPKIKEVALEMGLSLIDLYTEMDKNRPDWYLADGVHPTITGAGVIAQKVKEMLLMPKPVVAFANGKVTAPDGADYQWYLNGTPVGIANGGKLKEMNVTVSGKYKVSIKLNTANETRIVSQELDVQLTSINSIYSNNIKVYPNPTFDVIQVETDNIEKAATYTITDLSGKLLLKGQIQNGHGKINIAKLLKSTYILAIGNEQVKVIKSN